jgi:hypothetical protein
MPDHFVSGGGWVREERIGRLKCRALALLSVFSAFVAFVFLLWILDAQHPLQVFELPIIWLVAAALPALVFAILACVIGRKEKPRAYYVEVAAGEDLEKLY